MNALIRLLGGRIAKNFFALSILQGGNYLLPLALIPFLVRTLGMASYGDWAFAVSFAALFRTLVAYGFDMSATRTVSLRRDEREFVSELYASIIAVRFGLLALSCLILFVIGQLIPNVHHVLTLAMLSMCVLVGEVLFPIWLFQGMEQMSTITKLRLGYRASYVVATMVLVRGPEQILIIPILEGAGSLAAGLLAAALAHRTYQLSLRVPRPRFMIAQLREGWSIFVSTVAVHFYTTINTMIVGVMLGPLAVAQFSIAEKVYSAVRGMLGPVVQAVFPAISRIAHDNYARFGAVARRVTLAYAASLLVLAAAVFVLSARVVWVIAGTNSPVATQCLEILGIALIFAIGSLFSAFLVAQDRGAVLVRVTLATMVANLIVVVPLIHWYGVVGIALAMLITQVCHVAAQLVANRQLLFGDLDREPGGPPVTRPASSS